jgi:hypothetical protein
MDAFLLISNLVLWVVVLANLRATRGSSGESTPRVSRLRVRTGVGPVQPPSGGPPPAARLKVKRGAPR